MSRSGAAQASWFIAARLKPNSPPTRRLILAAGATLTAVAALTPRHVRDATLPARAPAATPRNAPATPLNFALLQNLLWQEGALRTPTTTADILNAQLGQHTLWVGQRELPAAFGFQWPNPQGWVGWRAAGAGPTGLTLLSVGTNTALITRYDALPLKRGAMFEIMELTATHLTSWQLPRAVHEPISTQQHELASGTIERRTLPAHSPAAVALRERFASLLHFANAGYADEKYAAIARMACRMPTVTARLTAADCQ